MIGQKHSNEIDADELYGDNVSLEELAGIESSELSDAGNLLDALNDEIEVQALDVEEEDFDVGSVTRCCRDYRAKA